MRVGGEIQVPGDKESLTHRALMLGAMAKGTSFIRGALTSLDARSTARVLRQLGAEISPLAPGRVTRIRSRGKFRRPAAALDCGNSGTTTRLLLGLLAAHPMTVTLTGDASLRRRPMRRVTAPGWGPFRRIIPGWPAAHDRDSSARSAISRCRVLRSELPSLRGIDEFGSSCANHRTFATTPNGCSVPSGTRSSGMVGSRSSRVVK
jgi:hypothetical protein